MKPYRSDRSDRHTAITVLSDIEEKAKAREHTKSVFAALPVPKRTKAKKPVLARLIGFLARR